LNVFDLIGPIMIGPSSSHTAGAVRIGRVLFDLLGTPPRSVVFELHQSFARTGPGHGTPQALMAGLLGMRPDDERIPCSLEMARGLGIAYAFRDVDLKDAHPNSVRISAVSADGSCRVLQGSSIGGGVIRVTSIDDLAVDFSGEFPTLVLLHEDRVGLIAEVTRVLAESRVNIANMRVFRSYRSGLVATLIETDQPASDAAVAALRAISGLERLAVLDVERED
jgi:L-serine dehydratase